MILKIIN